MPTIQSRQLGIALDMHGCPNRCRHCFVGGEDGPNGRLAEADLRWVAADFRNYARPGEERPSFDTVRVMSSTREPDYSDDYQRLAEVEAELNGGQPARFDLLSIWRLARDEKYARWAKSIGPDTCQITFFGLEEAQDWFCRRRGAFHDSLLATARLLDVGMKPRWQLFMTKKILPGLAGLMGLVDQMRIRERVAALSGKFDMFIHPPCLVGEGMTLADLSVSLDDAKLVPAELVESTRKHFKTDKIWTTEGEVVNRILADPAAAQPIYEYPPQPVGLWFLIDSDFNVNPNMGGHCVPWWRLGNLKADGVRAILDNFENDRILPLSINRPEVLVQLARQYGDPTSRRLVNSIEEHWGERYCAEHHPV